MAKKSAAKKTPKPTKKPRAALAAKKPKVGAKSRVLRHAEPAGGAFPPVQLTSRQMQAVERHATKHAGPFKTVLHEIFSEGIHLDVLPIAPTRKNPFHTFVTMGMSAVPMTTPAGYDAPRRAELCVVLPPEWKTDERSMDLRSGEWYWPIQGLKHLGRLPSSYDTFLDFGHTVPNGDPPEAFNAKCRFVCWMVVPPLSFKPGFSVLKAGGFTARFMQIIPLFREEMEHKLEFGAESLFDRFAELEVDPVRLCDPRRVNVCGKPAGKRPRAKAGAGS